MTYKKKANYKIGDRNYDDPAYKKWRKNVAHRDGFTCQWPKCGSTKQLRFHHIKRWAEYPNLRFELTNGITLCRMHHDKIWGKEEDFERLFYTILAQQTKGKTKRNKPSSKHNIRAELIKWQNEQT